MNKLLVVCFATVGLALASAETHNLKLLQKSQLGTTELNPGEYRMELSGDKMTIKGGKTKVEATVKVEASATKYNTNSILYKSDGGKYAIQEIHVGGTKTKVVVN